MVKANVGDAICILLIHLQRRFVKINNFFYHKNIL